MNSQSKKKNAGGFSLIELIVVVAMLTIVAAIAVGNYQQAVKASNEASAVAGIKVVISSQSSTETVTSFDSLISGGYIGEGFDDNDGDEYTAVRNGFKYLITPIGGSNFVISAIPESLGIFGTGSKRFGSNNSAMVYKDSENLDTHYITTESLLAGTSVPVDAD